MNDPFSASLFVEDIYTALGDLIRAAGGYKVVGAKLRPELMADVAGRWLSDCLNPDKRDKLDPAQIMWLLKEGRRVNCHTAIHFLVTDAGYSAPVPIEPRDEMAELQRQFIEATRAQSRLVERMEKLQPKLSRAT
jgi:hypothetical protein